MQSRPFAKNTLSYLSSENRGFLGMWVREVPLVCKVFGTAGLAFTALEAPHGRNRRHQSMARCILG
jgi:hypothetical protein